MGSECCSCRSQEGTSDPATGLQPHSRHSSTMSVARRDTSPHRALNSQAEEAEADEEATMKKEIRLAAKNLVLDIPISHKEVSEAWLSPVTCEGAALAVDLASVINSHSKSVPFRAFVKAVVIQECLIQKLLQNFKSTNESLRLSSAHLLSFLIIQSQFELIRIFVAADGLKKLKLLVASENSEGLVVAAARIATTVQTAGPEYDEKVQQTEILGLLLEKVKYMRKATYILETLEVLRDLPADSDFSASLDEVTRASSRGELEAESTPQLATLRATVATLQQRVSLLTS